MTYANPSLAMAQPLVSLTNLSLSYGSKQALRDVSLDIKSGEILGLVGPNGAGKSSLIKALLGQVAPQSGQIEFSDWQGSARGQKIAYVPQKQAVNLSFPISAQDVVAMGQRAQLAWFRRLDADARAMQRHVMESLDLWELRHRPFGELSGGQQQKALVARALCQKAALLILDEPFRGVDAASQASIVHALPAHQAQGGTTLIVHHGLELASELSDRLIALDGQVLALALTGDKVQMDELRHALGLESRPGDERDAALVEQVAEQIADNDATVNSANNWRSVRPAFGAGPRSIAAKPSVD